jgi:hypothetical protein
MKNENADEKSSGKKITLVFIVNGEPFSATVNINSPLKSAVEKVLSESENTGRPFSDWQVKYNGQVLDLNAKVEDLRLPDKVELLLSLKTGEGGING